MHNKYHRLILHYMSIFIVMIGIIQLIPLLVLPFYPEESSYAYCFLIPGLVAIAIGGLLSLAFKDAEIVYQDLPADADGNLLIEIPREAGETSCFYQIVVE